MNKLLSGLVICLFAMSNRPCCAQNESIAEISERSAAAQSLNPQLNRITQQLQQYQATLNESAGYPGVKQIQKDLVGHSLAEGVTNGYRSADWRWTIKEKQISRLRIVQVLSKTPREYMAIVQMRLSNGYYAYNAKAKIKYIRTAQNRWKMDYVVSEGMYIVVTHEYDNFIRSEIVDDGWGGTYCLQFTNMSELSLAIGGDMLTYNGWQRFSVLLKPNKKASVGGVFNGGSVNDYRINFIVRDN